MRRTAMAVLGAAALLTAQAARAEPAGEPAVVRLTLNGHRFQPETVVAPAGRPIRIELVNEDPALEEFDSQDLGVEKDITPHGRASVTLGPLKPGRYDFMGELHAATASGTLEVVEAP